MNNKRRKAIEILIDKLTDLKEEVDQVYQEESEAGESIPENMTERKEKSDECIQNLDDANNSLQETIDYLTSAIEQ